MLIQSPRRMKQILSFENLQNGKMHPTDVDGLIEYKNIGYIFFELKYNGKALPLGQRIALERIVKDLSKNKNSVALVCDHYVADTNKPVDVASARVREVYYSNQLYWRAPYQPMTAKQCTNQFINYLERSRQFGR